MLGNSVEDFSKEIDVFGSVLIVNGFVLMFVIV